MPVLEKWQKTHPRDMFRFERYVTNSREEMIKNMKEVVLKNLHAGEIAGYLRIF